MMAKLTFEIPDGLQKQLAKLSNIDEIAPKMIDEATPIFVQALKNSLANHKNTGDLQKSVKKYKAKKTKNGGWFGSIQFSGYSTNYITEKGTLLTRKEKTANAQKAMVLEYGRSDTAPQPFIEPTRIKSEKDLADKMQEVFNREAGL